MRRLIIKPNPAFNATTDPSRFHTHLRLDNGTEPRLKLSGFSYFGEIAGLRHINPGPSVVLFPEHNATDWPRLAVAGSPETRIRMTYAQWLAMLAAHKINLVRIWAFDLNESDSYPFHHTFGSDQYDLNVASTRYRRRLVRFIDLARRHGIVVHLTLSSDQMLRQEFWPKTPFHTRHAVNDQFGGDTGFDSFLNIGTSGVRFNVLRAMVKSLVTAVKPFWNVMFELMNEAGVTAAARPMAAQWHKTVAEWLDDDLNDGTGKRTHLVTMSAITAPVDLRAQIIDALVRNGENLVDVVSLHGNQWGGPDRAAAPTDEQIRADTRGKVTALYDRHPGRPFAVICDSDAFPLAQANPERYAGIALRDLNLNYAHRWHSSALSHAGLRNQLRGQQTATPDGLSFTDPSASPAPTPAISAAESALGGTRMEHTFLVKGKDIGAMRPADSVYMIGVDPAPNGSGVWKWTPSGGPPPGGNWSKVAGGAGVRITVDRDGRPWTVDANGAVRRLDGATWTNVPSPRATDIAAGGDGSVWLVGSVNLEGGHELYRLEGTVWKGVDNTGIRIAVDAVGRPWVVKSNGSLAYRDGETWVPMPGNATDVGAGHDGTVWIAESNGNIAYWLGTSFRSFPGPAIAIAVDFDGLPWFVMQSNVLAHQAIRDA